MEESRLIEISDIIESFDEKDLISNIHDQLYGESAYTGAVALLIDYLSPIYYKYESIVYDDDVTDDARHIASETFFDICKKIIEEICGKFGLEYDLEYLQDHDTDLSAITMALYFVFVLHFMDVLSSVMSNYIMKNKDDIVEVFADVASKKDMVTLVNKKHLTEQDATIVSNINNIGQWIFQNIDGETFMDYMDSQYLPGTILRRMLDEGAISGDFMTAISEEFHTNLGLKSKICFSYYCSKVDPGSLLDGTENL